jgi:hypothetical protein
MQMPMIMMPEEVVEDYFGMLFHNVVLEGLVILQLLFSPLEALMIRDLKIGGMLILMRICQMMGLEVRLDIGAVFTD